MLYLKKDFEQKMFLDSMAALDQKYDPAVRMCTSYRGKNGYHSRLSDCTVHEIRLSLEYAYLLLVRDAEGDRARSWDILYRVIPLQDMNPARNTYGIWQYYLEEDLEEMNPPDWNWADFNGKTLLRILAEYPERVPADLQARIRDSIGHACRAIIKRNVGPGYTNISIMGAYVTIFAGELLGIEEFLTYGRERLQKLYDFNMSHNNFSEFNSPTYTFVCVRDLAAFRSAVKDPQCLRLASELENLAWETIALHYHTATGQLAGPHDRAYAMLLDRGTKLSIERALDYRISLLDSHDFVPGAEMFTLDLRCPDKFIPYFTEPSKETVLDQTFAPGRMAYTYMSEKFTLGSLHREVAWNQHRNVLGYFGTVQKPVAVCVKCLHDDWDYCSGIMATIQDKNRTLTAFGFADNGGDTHVNLDMVKNKAISAADLRIRTLFEGAVESLTAEQTGERTFLVTHENGLKIRVSYPLAMFGDTPVTFEIVRVGNKLGIDAVLYHGEKTTLDFTAIAPTAVCVALEMDAADDTPAAEAEIRDEKLFCRWDNLQAEIRAIPDDRGVILKSHALFRDGEAYVPAF